VAKKRRAGLQKPVAQPPLAGGIGRALGNGLLKRPSKKSGARILVARGLCEVSKVLKSKTYLLCAVVLCKKSLLAFGVVATFARISTQPSVMSANLPNLSLPQWGMNKICLSATSAALLCLSLLTQTSRADEFSDREVLRQQEQLRQRRQAQETAPEVWLQAPVLADQTRLATDEQPCFVIQQIIWDKPPGFAWLDEAIKGHDDAPLQRCLGAKGIALVVKRAQDALVAQGFITSRVLAPAQNLSAGVLNLTLIPGRIAAIRLAPSSNPRANPSQAIPAQAGDLLNLRDIEQGLENLQRVPTAQADIQIVPTQGELAQPGQSDLVVAWQQSQPFRVNLSLDDSGTQATGRYQTSLTLSYDHWWAANDLFYITLGRDAHGAASHGTDNQALHYSIPWGYNLLALTAYRSNYHQTIAGVTQNYVYSGTSQGYGLELMRVVQRNATGKTTLQLQAFMRESRNFIDDAQIQVQHRRVGGWEVGLSHTSAWGPLALQSSFKRKRGSGAFGSIRAPEEAFGEGTSRFELSTAELNLTWPFTWGATPWRYSGLWRGQANHTALSPQERFAIGGRYSVRGFDGESSLSGERGWYLRNELGVLVGSGQIYLGMDVGEVAGPSGLVGQRLGGGVLGWRGQLGALQYDLFLGGPIHHPQAFKTANTVAGLSLSVGF
jgi:hemolysin activation/secretion protein